MLAMCLLENDMNFKMLLLPMGIITCLLEEPFVVILM